jgi:short-subunit dehydrogenase involved in D-alanine esterification of teichoic acids
MEGNALRVLITGANRGIGLELVKLVLERTSNFVIMAGRNMSRLTEAA